jgi:hypothetical protein
MPLLNGLRIVMIVQVLTLLLQATFAGMMIGGNHHAANLHEFTAKILAPLALVQTVLAIAWRVQARCPLWVPVASAALFPAEIVEFSAGHLHNVALHVPLGVAIFGGALRQSVWATSAASARPQVQA